MGSELCERNPAVEPLPLRGRALTAVRVCPPCVAVAPSLCLSVEDLLCWLWPFSLMTVLQMGVILVCP